ncbi:MAG: hypothetical protein KJ060_05595 [Candidatus Hydrogenedentes bacterium]|nr:hypothetical protein [Candidatus Hydrogenedentota bacterium]
MRNLMVYLFVAAAMALILPGCGQSVQPAGEVALAATKEAPQPAPDVATPEAADPIESLNDKLESLGAKVVADQADDTEESGQDYESLAAEVSELRAEVKRLQETIDLTISYVVGDLQEENRRLREEIARVYSATPGAADGNNDIVYLRPDSMTAPDPAADDAAPQPPVDYGDKGYAIVKEWGRSPEEVSALGKGIPSLKGMIGVVPANLSDEELSEIGRAIHAEFDAYDNMVIEVFDNETAAKAYAETNVRSAQHNVLSIQKDGASGRDHILLNRNGVSIAVPR